MAITLKYKIEDKNTNEALKELDKNLSQITEKTKVSSYEIKPQEITNSDLKNMKEGVRYIDTKPDGSNRMIIKVNGKLKGIVLTDIDCL